MEPDDVGEITQESPKSRHDRHDHSVDQHRLDRQLEPSLHKVNDYGSTASCHVGQEVKDRVEDGAELNSLILENTEGVARCSEDIVEDEIGDKVDDGLFEIDNVFESVPDLSACQLAACVK